jgi:nickel transport protein
MSRRLKSAAIVAGLILAIGPFVVPQTASAHGTGYRQSDKKPISLEFSYSTGETMSYLEAKVFSPKDEKFAFQSGRTDEDGRFAFTPNAAGQWRVVVKDEEGHLAEAKIDVAQGFLDASDKEGSKGEGKVDAIVEKTAMPGGMDLAVRSALGVSLLFNVAALTSLARRRKPAGEAS